MLTPPISVVIHNPRDSELIQKIWFKVGISWWYEKDTVLDLAKFYEYPMVVGPFVICENEVVLCRNKLEEAVGNTRLIQPSDFMTKEQLVFHELGGMLSIESLNLTIFKEMLNEYFPT